MDDISQGAFDESTKMIKEEGAFHPMQKVIIIVTVFTFQIKCFFKLKIMTILSYICMYFFLKIDYVRDLWFSFSK